MVTKDVIPISDWSGHASDDPNDSPEGFRWWGQRVCLSQDIYIGQPFDHVPIEFDVIDGTGFKEWADGRREPGDP